MKTKTIRATLQFDSAKESDIINVLESLADQRQLSNVLANLVRLAVDGSGENIKKINMPVLSSCRAEFFNSVNKQLAEQDRKIDAIYSMCSDLYGLAMFNKAMGLEGKTDNIMLGQFNLQRQQGEIKAILGENDIKHTYESNRLLNEKEKADKIMTFIAKAYEAMISEMKPLLFQEIQIPVKGIAVVDEDKTTAQVSNSKSLLGSKINMWDTSDNDDDFIELVEKPKEKAVEKPKDLDEDIVFDSSNALNILSMMGTIGSD